MEDFVVDKIVNNGVGLVLLEKVYELYEGLYFYFQICGIDGVKVDVIYVRICIIFVFNFFLNVYIFKFMIFIV